MKVAALAGIDEFKNDLLADSFDVTIAPIFERKSRSLAATFFDRTLVGAARRMRVDLIWRPVRDVNAPAVRPPPRNTGSEVFVGVGAPPVVLFLILVLRRIRR